MTHTDEQFNEAIGTFLLGCYKISNDHRERHFPNCPVVEFEIRRGPKNAKIVRRDPQTSVHCFVEIATGNVLKAAGWKAPAKHARGNIFDDHNGLGSMNEYGPAYLR